MEDAFLDRVRDPTEEERGQFQAAVQTRDEDALLRLFREHPFTLWAIVNNQLTNEERVWTRAIAEKAN